MNTKREAGEKMNIRQSESEFSVEYQDPNGVLYYRNIKATDFAEAKAYILQRYPDVVIRAVTLLTDDDNANDKN
ncbi:hypothetical protein [Paenibacillus contaminans]|nr:hypothetical protein [Paenibacillus contaminans]